MIKPSYTHEEVYGQSCNHLEYIDADIDMVFEYAANPYSLEEFSATVRSIEHIGDGLYKGKDLVAKDTDIYIKMEAFADSRVVDCLCAWDQSRELWMRYFWRLFDANPVLGKRGTLLQWINFRHPYYDKSHNSPPDIAEPRARTDRMWVGDFWPLFKAAHAVEAKNLKAILEHRQRVRETTQSARK